MNILSSWALFMLRLAQVPFSGFNTIAEAVGWTNAATWHHETITLQDNEYLKLSQFQNADHLDFNETLDAILIPRVPGTKGHVKVKEYIKSTMQSLGWTVEEDAFSANTPHGTKPFSNVIATLNPQTCRRLVLSCHYDSKVSKEGRFLGATDSAVPCAMLIHLAKSLHDALQTQKEQEPLNGLTLQLIFFDGEEAFEQWSQTDSLYGSKHLAHKWDKTRVPPEIQRQCTKPKGSHSTRGSVAVQDIQSELDRIDVLVLLDLLGSANPSFYSYFSHTNPLYSRLVRIERRLNDLKAMESHPPKGRTSYFENRQSFSFIEDDHVPFLKRGVPILHIIPTPFPSVWHTNADNRENLHHPTINNLNKVFRIFVAEYLKLAL